MQDAPRAACRWQPEGGAPGGARCVPQGRGATTRIHGPPRTPHPHPHPQPHPRLPPLQDERLQDLMDSLRGKFKAVAAGLGLTDAALFPQQQGGGAGEGGSSASALQF